MQAVFLMAGKGSRMAKHVAGPKQLMLVAGKPVIEHTIDNLPSEVTSLVFIVGGPHEETIRAHFASGSHRGRPITFVKQENPAGTAHAFWAAAPVVKGKFLGLFSDEIIGACALASLASQSDCAILGRRVADPSTFGVLVLDDYGNIQNIVEKPKHFVSDIAIAGAYLLDQDFLKTRVPASPRGEYEAPDVVMALIGQGKRFTVVETDKWMTVNDKDELEAARKSFEDETADATEGELVAA